VNPLLAIPLLTAVLANQPTEPTAPPEPAERVLIDRELIQQNVKLSAIDGESVRVIDATGRTLVLPRTQVLALLPPLSRLDPPHVPTPPELPLQQPRRGRLPIQEPTPPPPPAPKGRLELTDGQVLPGTLTAGANGDSISWRSTLWGPMEVPLDVVAAVVIQPDRFDAAMRGISPTQDAVLLANGDRLEGFVASLGSEVKLEQGDKLTNIPLARVDGVRLANPVRPAPGAWVWTADTAAAVSQITLTPGGTYTIAGRIPGASSQPTATASAEEVLGVCFDAGVLRPLAELPMTAGPLRDTSARRWTSPPVVTPGLTPLGAADIELPGPMRVEWTLPPNATRFSATLELPPSARLWGDCEAVIESVGPSGNTAPLAREPLNQGRPVAHVNTPLNGAARLRITIDPGPSGPIQDRVVVRRGLVLTPSAP
jgi:hypothetical protein